MWTIFKLFIEFVTISLLFYVLGFGPWGMWDLKSPTRPTPPALEDSILATGPPAKSPSPFFLLKLSENTASTVCVTSCHRALSHKLPQSCFHGEPALIIGPCLKWPPFKVLAVIFQSLCTLDPWQPDAVSHSFLLETLSSPRHALLVFMWILRISLSLPLLDLGWQSSVLGFLLFSLCTWILDAFCVSKGICKMIPIFYPSLYLCCF